jgi:hypothetical protein
MTTSAQISGEMLEMYKEDDKRTKVLTYDAYHGPSCIRVALEALKADINLSFGESDTTFHQLEEPSVTPWFL